VTGLDPALASLDIARAKPFAESWRDITEVSGEFVFVATWHDRRSA
jgi:hypothetical protein